MHVSYRQGCQLLQPDCCLCILTMVLRRQPAGPSAATMLGPLEFLGRKLGGPSFLRHPLFRLLSCAFLMAVVLQYSGILLLTRRYTVSRLSDVIALDDNLTANGRSLLGDVVDGDVLVDADGRQKRLFERYGRRVPESADGEGDDTGEVQNHLLGHRKTHYRVSKSKVGEDLSQEVPQDSNKESRLKVVKDDYDDEGELLNHRLSALPANDDTSAENTGDYTQVPSFQHLTRTAGITPTRASVMQPMWNFFHKIKQGILPDAVITTPKPLLPCPKQPTNLEGPVNVLFSAPAWEILEKAHPEVKPGGHWTPLNCTARHRVALVIPYRDRDSHLRIFLQHMHPFLQHQMLDYTVYLVEQAEGSDFNRAMLMNIGFAEAEKLRHHDCFVFHDVDLLPEIAQNMYSCPHLPRHMSAAVDSLGYRLPYQGIFGGVSALRTEHFRRVNGFSNCFFGWGGEDDDMYNRIKHHGLDITRYPLHIARYRMLTHRKEMPSNDRFTMLNSGKLRYDTDGISSLIYHLEMVEKHHLYTRIRVQLNKEEVINKSRAFSEPDQTPMTPDGTPSEDSYTKNEAQGGSDYQKESQEQLTNEIPHNNDHKGRQQEKETRSGAIDRSDEGGKAGRDLHSVASRLERLLHAHDSPRHEQQADKEEQETQEERDNLMSSSLVRNQRTRAARSGRRRSDGGASKRGSVWTPSKAMRRRRPTS